MALQALEGVGQFEERRTIAQGPRLALDDRQIMAPIIDGTPWPFVSYPTSTPRARPGSAIGGSSRAT